MKLIFASIIFTVLGLLTNAQAAFVPVPSTGLPYTIIIADVYLNNGLCPVNTQIGAFSDTTCVGAEIYQGVQNFQLITWEGDPSQNLNGFSNGDSIIFKARVPLLGDYYPLEATAVLSQGNGTFGYGTYTVAQLYLVDPVLKLQVNFVHKPLCYPNPFTEKIQIETGMARSSVAIRSVSGQVVSTLQCDHYGNTSWNGLMSNGCYATSGLYIIEIQNTHNSTTRLIQFAGKK